MSSCLQTPLSQRIDSIQLLRAIAAIAVVTQHIPIPVFGDGLWGVDLFFVISGFIMCHATARSGRHFFLKRIIRIIPLYWLGTLCIYVLALTIPQLLNTTTANPVDLLKSLFFIPFLKGDIPVPIVFQGWTLNYEMFFYGLFWLSLLINRKYRIMICSVLLCVVVIAGKLTSPEGLILQFFSSSIVLEFALGMLCYILLVKINSCQPTQSALARSAYLLTGAFALLSLPFAASFIPFDDRFVKWGLLSAVVFFCFVRGLDGIKLSPKILLVGDASYSLYLFHPYVIQLFNKVFGLAAIDAKTSAAYLWSFALIILCVAVSIVMYLRLERPISIALRFVFFNRNLEMRRSA